MSWIRTLLSPHRRARHYAWVDSRGLCQAFHQGQQPPTGPQWVQVHECRLSWLQRPLPSAARVAPVVTQPRTGHPLPA
ncbi:MAG: hypothetical protein ABWY06_09885 [Pseudomonas sp.]|uniref:hypothetical protein n=1 Tax=Pseudomonas sp. TaxID=306 RepID=UPI00339B82A6